MNLDFLMDEPSDVYHSKVSEFLSSHQLAKYRKSPALYQYDKCSGEPQEETLPMMIGRATHTRILEGRDVYEREYAIGGPLNPAMGKPYGSTTKKFAEWVAEQSNPVVSYAQSELIENLASSVHAHELAKTLLAQGRAKSGTLRRTGGFVLPHRMSCIRSRWSLSGEHDIVRHCPRPTEAECAV